MRAVLAIALAMALVGCGVSSTTSSGITVPAGPQLNQFALAPRCPAGDASCTDRALELAEEMLRHLEAPLPPADGAPTGTGLVVPFTVQVDHDPSWEWRSADGTSGSTGAATIDLEPFLAGRGPALVRIGGDDPAYAAPGDLTQQLIDALFIRGG